MELGESLCNFSLCCHLSGIVIVFQMLQLTTYVVVEDRSEFMFSDSCHFSFMFDGGQVLGFIPLRFRLTRSDVPKILYRHLCSWF